MSDRLIRRAEVERVTGLCERWIRNLESEGRFPHRVKLVTGGRAVAWSEQEVADWVAERLTEREA